MDFEKNKQELLRLQKSPTETKITNGIGVVRFIVRCPLGAKDVLKYAKSIHEIVLSNSCGQWPEVAEWKQRLPRWFIDACSPPLSQEEAELQLQTWLDLSPQEQAETECEKEWSLVPSNITFTNEVEVA